MEKIVRELAHVIHVKLRNTMDVLLPERNSCFTYCTRGNRQSDRTEWHNDKNYFSLGILKEIKICNILLYTAFNVTI